MPYQTERKRELFMAEKMRDGKVRCSFCHKSEDQVRKLIAGPEGVFICDECIGICSEIMEEELAQYDTEDVYDSDINLLKPEEIHKILDDYVSFLVRRRSQRSCRNTLSDRMRRRKFFLLQFTIIIRELLLHWI